MYEILPPRALRDIRFVDADAEIALLEDAIRRHHAERVAAAAARLAGWSAQAGADLVHAIAEELEARAHAHDLTLAAHLLASLEYALVETKANPRPLEF